MRPIKLILSAFGAYVNETTIEFDKFGDKGIYLISGKTGAGKTAIFDAICYALYGTPSGNTRDVSMFRSKYADDNIETFVDLTFSYRDKVYNVRRNPRYQRAKKRGEGLGIEDASAHLILPNGKSISKKTLVNKEIEKILGVNREQFSQIAMISQGEFLKLIIAGTKERQEIFSDIFKTAYYEKLEIKLKRYKKELNDELTKLEQSINQYKEGINYIINDENNKICTELEELIDNNIHYDRFIELLDLIIADDNENKLKLEQELIKVDNKILEIGTRLKDKLQFDNEYNEIHELECRLKKLEDEHIIYEQKLQIAQREGEKSDSIKAHINKIAESLNLYAEFDVLNKKLTKLNDEEVELKNLVKKNNDDLEKINIRMENIKNELESIGSIDVNKIKLDTDIAREEDELNTLNEIINKLEELININIERKKAIKNYEDKNNEYHILEDKYRINRDRYYDELAGSLAKKLSDNEPCPVCGATIHPNLAKFSDETITKDMLDKLEQKLKKAKIISEQASEKSAKIGDKATEIKAFIMSKSTEVNFEYKEDVTLSRYSKDKLMLQDKINKLKRKRKQIEIKLKRKEELESILPDLENSIATINDKFQKNNIQIVQNRLECKNILENKSKLQEILEFDNTQMAKNKIDVFTKQLEKIESDIKQATYDIEISNAQLQNLRGQISAKRKFLESKEELKEVRIEDIETELEHNKAFKREMSLKIADISTRIAGNKNASCGIKSKNNQLVKIQNKYASVKELADTASGDISGKDRITLETYVQMNYFDRIIERANIRLMKMTSGQYEMVRNTNSSDQRIRSGLDLDVIDHYNSSVRSVKSLSGGESFKASLSLALGLSDEVQSMAGGIKIDTMFVDEGFGTLDEHSLNNAIKTLIDLSEDNRLIGIISHVAELKDRIDKQIIVTKDNNGVSTAKIVCG